MSKLDIGGLPWGAMKLHLVDGTLDLFRCFHGAPRARNAAGEEVGACRGLAHTLVKLLRDEAATHVAVAFDTVVDATPPGGGAPRPVAGPGVDPDLRRQHPLAAEVARALGLVIWPMIRLQADDALATGAARFREAPGVEQVVIATTDLDLLQCVVGERVVLWDRIRDRITDEAAVRERTGVAPGSVPDWLALKGDPSDGLPGLPGFGPKSAGAVLARWGRIEAIPDDPDDWDVAVRGAARLAGVLRKRRAEVLLHRNLSRKRTDVPLPQTTLRELAWPGADRARVAALVDRLEEDGFVGRIPRWSSQP